MSPGPINNDNHNNQSLLKSLSSERSGNTGALQNTIAGAFPIPDSGLENRTDSGSSYQDRVSISQKARDQFASSADASSTVSGDEEEQEEESEAIKYIREFGLMAYLEKQRQDKIDEIREEILTAMGLTEESLKALPADQIKSIEEAISAEIKKQLAAENMLNADEDDSGPGSDNLRLVQQHLGIGAGGVNEIGLEAALADDRLFLSPEMFMEMANRQRDRQESSADSGLLLPQNTSQQFPQQQTIGVYEEISSS